MKPTILVILLFLLVLIMVGCASSPQTVEVRVPVPVPCKVPEVEIQPLPVDALSEADDIFGITKALWASVEIQRAQIFQLQAAVKACQ
jgi:hypothetical protein